MEKRIVETAKVFLIDPNRKLPLLHRPEVDAYRCGWDLPGGEILANESPTEAAIRETFEETGIQLSPDKLFPFPENPYKNESIKGKHTNLRHFFVGKLLVPEPDIKLSNEHDRFEWTSLSRAHLYSMLGHYVQRQRLDFGIRSGLFDSPLLVKQR